MYQPLFFRLAHPRIQPHSPLLDLRSSLHDNTGLAIRLIVRWAATLPQPEVLELALAADSEAGSFWQAFPWCTTR